MPEGDGTVLDNSCLMFLSNMWSAASTTTPDCRWCWPEAWAARSRPGRSLDYLKAGDENRKMCSLYLSIMDRMGVKLDHFGDADNAVGAAVAPRILHTRRSSSSCDWFWLRPWRWFG